MEALQGNVAIACFAFNRPIHTERMLSSLLSNAEAHQLPIYVFCDGPRSREEKVLTDSVRSIVNSYRESLQIVLVDEEANRGLFTQITSGVSEVLKRFEMVIVVEDDLVLSPFFIRYMLDGLTLYRSEDKVISIHGYMYPHTSSLPDTFLIRGADCWGWATWRRGWELFSDDADQLLTRLSANKLVRRLNYDRGNAFSEMLLATSRGNISSWAICWHASAVLENRLTLYPGNSLVANIGNDGTGTHSSDTVSFDTPLRKNPVVVAPIAVKESREGLRAIQQHVARMGPSSSARIRKQILKKWGKFRSFVGAKVFWVKGIEKR